jgi:REP element-mobilizing transposase RayT
MPQSLSNILIHIIFSTKNRAPLIPTETAPELYRYMASISQAHCCGAHQIGGTENQAHLWCSLARTETCEKLVEEIKTGSSKWMKAQARVSGTFAWQNGYGAFSVGQDQLDALRKYIEKQAEHHARITFEEEFRELLRRHRIRYDERYVWD